MMILFPVVERDFRRFFETEIGFAARRIVSSSSATFSVRKEPCIQKLLIILGVEREEPRRDEPRRRERERGSETSRENERQFDAL